MGDGKITCTEGTRHCMPSYISNLADQLHFHRSCKLHEDACLHTFTRAQAALPLAPVTHGPDKSRSLAHVLIWVARDNDGSEIVDELQHFRKASGSTKHYSGRICTKHIPFGLQGGIEQSSDRARIPNKPQFLRRVEQFPHKKRGYSWSR